MRISHLCVVLSVLTLSAGPSASAQLCLGTAPYSAGPVQVAAGAQFAKHAKAYGADVAFGAKNGGFAGMGVSKTSYDDLNEGSSSYSAILGFSVPVSKVKKVDFCPLVTADMTSGPDIDTGSGIAELSGASFGLGFGIGGIASSSATFDFVPFATAAYYHVTSKAEFAGSSAKTTDDVGQVTVGAGFVLNKVVTLEPNISFPVGVQNGDPSFGLTITLSLGAKK
jgi:hypothetical protein